MRTLLGRALGFVLFLSFVMAAPAAADMVTVAVTGQVTESDFTAIAVGSVVTGYYRYDAAAPDLHPETDDYAVYNSIALSLSFADDSTISSSDCLLYVNNNSMGSGTVDEYFVSIPYYPKTYTATGVFADLELHMSGLNRIYRGHGTGAAWDSDALPDPESVLALAPIDQSGLGFGVEADSEDLSVLNFELTDLSVVPVPGALVLAGLGLGSSGWLVRRRNRPI